MKQPVQASECAWELLKYRQIFSLTVFERELLQFSTPASLIYSLYVEETRLTWDQVLDEPWQAFNTYICTRDTTVEKDWLKDKKWKILYVDKDLFLAPAHLPWMEIIPNMI